MVATMTTPRAGFSGTHTTNGRPNGYSSITPFIVLNDPSAALDFYQSVFGAQLISSMVCDDVVMHAELEFASGRLQLGANQPSYNMTCPDPESDNAAYSLALYVTDVDATVERAVAAGATVREPAVNFVSGDRYASIRDPFGVRWSIMTRVEDLSDEESAAKVEAWMAQQS